MKIRFFTAAALLSLSLLAACAGASTPQPAATLSPSATAPAPTETAPAPTATAEPEGPAALPEGYRDVTVEIDGVPVQLTDGQAEMEAAPGSASKIVTKITGEAASGDLNGDGQPDAAFLLTQEGGGSGTFYYAAATLTGPSGLSGSKALFLGDRIEPQSLAIQEDGALVVSYLERKPDQPFTEKPTVSVTKTLRLRDGGLDETSQLSRPQLVGRAWRWVTMERTDGTLDSPIKLEAFTITFAADGTVSGTTDCNSFGGKYALAGDEITFSEMMSTQMFCDGSQEADFQKYLSEVKSYEITGQQLVLKFADGAGQMTFE